jgi:ketosteroid isomerase-like protein
MKIVPTGMIVAFAVLLISGPPARADDQQTRQALQPIYDKLADIIKNKQEGGAADLLTSDYKEIDLFGQKHTREQVRERLKKALAATESIESIHAEVLRVVTKGDHALALTRRKAVATIDDKDKKPHKYVLEGYALDLWDKVGDDWKLARTEQLAMRTTLDGKPMKIQVRKRPARQASAGTAALALQSSERGARIVRMAQFYVTPYNYGWGGYGYGYNGGYNYGAGNAIYTAPYQNRANFWSSVNQQNAPHQAAIYQQQLAYERALKQHKAYQAYLKKEEAAMQKQLQEEQQARQQEPQSTQ